MNYLFLTTNFALKLRGNVENVVTFTVHLSLTIKRLTRYNQKAFWPPLLPSNMAANHQIILLCFLSNFGCKIIVVCTVNFWHQQDYNSLFKGSIGQVSSSCKWPIWIVPLNFSVLICNASYICYSWTMNVASIYTPERPLSKSAKAMVSITT